MRVKFFLLIVVFGTASFYVARTNNRLTMRLKLIKLKPGSKLSSRNLLGADLEGVDLSDSDLSCANLTFANLDNANLSGADLRGANLSQTRLFTTKLSGANVAGCNFFGAHFTRPSFEFGKVTRQADLSEVDLREAKLPVAYFSGGLYEKIDLSGADLSHADFTHGRFRYSNFTNSNLKGAKLSYSDFLNADFRFAYLGGSDLSNSIFVRADFSKAFLGDAKCHDGNSDFTGAKFRDANLNNCSLLRATINQTDFRGAQVDGLRIYDDQIQWAIGLDVSRVEIYGRESNKPIKDKKVQTQSGKHAKADFEKKVTPKSDWRSFDISHPESHVPKHMLDAIGREIDAFVEQIRLVRGTDISIAFSSRSYNQLRLEFLRQIGEEAVNRMDFWCKRILDEPLIFDREEAINEIDRQFKAVSRALQGR
mgnify:FL=1